MTWVGNTADQGLLDHQGGSSRGIEITATDS